MKWPTGQASSLFDVTIANYVMQVLSAKPKFPRDNSEAVETREFSPKPFALLYMQKTGIRITLKSVKRQVYHQISLK